MKLIPKGKYSKNIAILITGTVLAQAIPLLLTPVLTHLYTPEDFGVFGLYISITGFLGVVVCARYELAVMLPKEDSQAVQLVALCFRITLFMTALVTGVVFFAHEQIAAAFNSPELEPWLWLLPVSTFFIGSFQSLYYWINRRSKYKQMAASRIARATISSGASIGLFFSMFRSGGLIIGDVIGQAVSAVVLFVGSFSAKGTSLKEVNREGIRTVAGRYKSFPKYNLTGAVLEKAAHHLPVWLFMPFFGPGVTGFLVLSQRIVAAPGSVIARAFGDVFRQQAAERFIETGECKALFDATLKRLLLFSVIPFIIFFFVAPWLFGAIFGQEWVTAGLYAKIMTPMFLLQFISNPLANMFIVAEKQKYELYLQALLFSGVLASILVGYYVFKSEFIALVSVTAVYCVKYVIELIMSYQFSRGTAKA